MYDKQGKMKGGQHGPWSPPLASFIYEKKKEEKKKTNTDKGKCIKLKKRFLNNICFIFF